MRKYFALTVVLLSTALLSFAQKEATWLRYPSISPDRKTIVFEYKGDLYKVPSTGGVAQPLTLHEAHDYMPVWSHDGKWIAFASDRYGNFDIFLMPSTGGEPKRLTYYSVGEMPYDFSADDKYILFGAARMDAADNRQFPSGYMQELYKVSVSGGRVQQVLTTPAVNVKVGKGNSFIYEDVKGQENNWRKHHISSVARDIWSYDAATGNHKKITTSPAEDRNAVFTADEKSIYYLSEASGSFNVYTMQLSDAASAKAVTNFKTNPVRFLSIATDGTLCFSQNGDIYTKGSGEAQKLNITIAADDKYNNEKIIQVSGNTRELAVSPNGKEVAFIFRGEVFVTSIEGSTTKRITNTPEQEVGVSFSPDGKSLLYASERNNSWKIYQTEMQRKDELYIYASTVASRLN